MESGQVKICNTSKWTLEEDKVLLKELERNIPIHIIANMHGKSQESVNQRRKAISYRLYKKRIEIGEISQMTRLAQDEIFNFIKKRREYIAEKKSVF